MSSGQESNDQWSTADSAINLLYDSSGSSTSQQATKLATYSESVYAEEDINVQPCLRIIEQPQRYFKFRYETEMGNSHGCLRGSSYKKGSNDDTFPEVELVNFTGRALIRCQLVQVNIPTEEHPHKLSSAKQTDNNGKFEVIVPENDQYQVRFAGLSIINKKTNEVQQAILQSKYNIRGMNLEEIQALRQEVKKRVKAIDLNRVRLKFSVHCLETDAELCDPVYSDPINNMNNLSTGILKICRLSTICSSVVGNESIIMLVEKVHKKDIQIRFFEENDDGILIWKENGRFLECNVHHQCAIEFKTPRYKDQNLTKKVKVYIELVRPSDESTSNRVDFYYTPDPYQRHKKRKIAYCQNRSGHEMGVWNNFIDGQNHSTVEPQLTNLSSFPPMTPSVQAAGEIALDQLSESTPDDMSLLLKYMDDENSNFNLSEIFGPEMVNMTKMTGDSGRARTKACNIEEHDESTVRKMVEKLQYMVRLKRYMDATSHKNLTQTLEDLFGLRLLNGDTFLHLTIGSQQPFITYIIQLAQDMNLTHLLNLKNDKMMTVLHLSVVNDLPDLTAYLLAKGCDPMLEDLQGNNAIHYAVIFQSCLEPLLDFVTKRDENNDLDVFNDANPNAFSPFALIE